MPSSPLGWVVHGSFVALTLLTGVLSLTASFVPIASIPHANPLPALAIVSAEALVSSPNLQLSVHPVSQPFGAHADRSGATLPSSSLGHLTGEDLGVGIASASVVSSPITGPVNTTVTVSGSGLLPSQSYSVYLDPISGSQSNFLMGGCGTDASGAFVGGSCNVYVNCYAPTANGEVCPAGTDSVDLFGCLTSSCAAKGYVVSSAETFDVTNAAGTSSPTSGPYGTTLSVTATGLAPQIWYHLGLTNVSTFGSTGAIYNLGNFPSNCTTTSSGALTGSSGIAPCEGTVGQFSSPPRGTYCVDLYMSTSHLVYCIGLFAIVSSPAYAITFTEKGLTLGTSWAVTLNSVRATSSSPSVDFNEPNGTYSFSVGAVTGYSASPLTGSVNVNGAAVKEIIDFSHGPYAVFITETGLRNGTHWSASLANTNQTATAPNATVFAAVNGTYAFYIDVVGGYTASPASGTVAVKGTSTTKEIHFSPVSGTVYNVTFREMGLVPGGSWLVSLNGSTESTIANTIYFQTVGGNYSYSVGTVPGFTASPTSGSVSVRTSSLLVNISFFLTGSPNNQTSPWWLFGLPGYSGYFVWGGVAIVVSGGSVVAIHHLHLKRRKGA